MVEPLGVGLPGGADPAGWVATQREKVPDPRGGEVVQDPVDLADR